MHTIARKLIGAASVAAIATGGLTLAPSPASASTACTSACIQGLAVLGTPQGAVFDFNTSALTRVKVVVTDPDGKNPLTVKNDNSWGSSYHVVADDNGYFKQGTVYRYSVFATDTAGATWRSSGELGTLKRSANVEYGMLHVIKDGDDIGPGDFYGYSRCKFGPDWPDWLLPTTGVDDKTELNDGESHPLSAASTCDTPVGDSVEVQTAVVDDDFDPGLSWGTSWEPTSPYDLGSWSSPNYDWAYTHLTVSDPLAPTATGSTTVPISATSPTTDNDGAPAPIRYSVDGSVTFTQTAPSAALEAPVSGPATLDVHVTTSDSADDALVSWNTGAFPAIDGATATRVQWRPRGATTWTTTDMVDPSANQLPLKNLKLGTTYDIAVSRLVPGGLLALRSETSYTTPGELTTLSGWSDSQVDAPVGSSHTYGVQVSTDKSVRKIEVQHRKLGGSAWTTASTVSTDTAGHATITVKTSVGMNEWRLHVLASTAFQEATSATKLFGAKTSIGGFNATQANAATGTTLNDTITVTPGAYRTVFLVSRKTGSSSWGLYTTRVTKADGTVILPEVAQKGSYQWAAYVPQDDGQGTKVVSATRTIVGS